MLLIPGHEVSMNEEREIRDERTRQLEERLQDSEARFRNIFEYSNDAIFLLDPDLNQILDVNVRACRMLGYTRDEFLSTAYFRDIPRRGGPAGPGPVGGGGGARLGRGAQLSGPTRRPDRSLSDCAR